MEAKENKRDVKTKNVKKTEHEPVNETLEGVVTGCELLYVRSEADVNYELQMAHMNRELNPDIETIFLPTNTKYSFISSSLIKEVLAFDADVKNLVPKQVLIALKNKSKGR